MSRQLATTKMSSRGQIVIPEEIREQLGLETGTKFVVIAEDDTVVLKTITPPSKKELKALLSKVRNQVKKSGIKRSEVEKIIKAERIKAKKIKNVE